MHLLHRSNDTGHWRGSNDLLRIPVGNWLRALPAEIATGGTPGLWEIRNRAAAKCSSPVGII